MSGLRRAAAHLVGTGLALAVAVGVWGAPAAAAAEGRSGGGDGDVPTAVGGDVRVVHAVSGGVRGTVTATVDGGPSAAFEWATAGPWWHVSTGRHIVDVTAPSTSASLALDVCAGCRVTVVAVQTDAADPRSLRLQPLTSPMSERMPAGRARIEAVVHAEADAGPAEVEVAGRSARIAFLGRVGPFDVPAGLVTLRFLAPSTGEVFAADTRPLAAGASYTVLWAGAGETPVTLVVLNDAAQSSDAPPSGLPINTGFPDATAAGPNLLVGGILIGGALVVYALLIRPRRRPRVPSGVLLVVLFAGVCSSCGPGGATAENPPTTTRRTGVAFPPSTPVATTAMAVIGADPARLRVPSLGLDTPVRALAMAAISGLPRTLAPDAVAWVRGTGRLSVPGTELIIGHHNFDGSGAFARLRLLQPGQSIVVHDDRGRAYTYVVVLTMTMPKGEIPSWLWAPQARPSVALVSCDGPRDPRTGLHTDNVLVWATAPNSPTRV